MGISVVIPTIDEGRRLPALVARLHHQPEIDEVLVADGGSQDGSVGEALRQGARVISCPQRQRAAQMNTAAAQAQGSILWFIHADCLPPQGAAGAITNCCHDPEVIGGAFRRRFAPGNIWLTLTAGLADLRLHAFGLSLGDQAPFVRRQVFQHIGGFTNRDQFEDLEFARRLTRLGRLVTISRSIRSSDRRFASGLLRRSLSDGWLLGRFLSAG